MSTHARRLSQGNVSIAVTAVVAIAGLLAGCSSHSKDLTKPSNVVEVSLSPSSAQYLQIGQTEQMSASPLDLAGNVVGGETVAWSSSDSTIATVSSSGLVRALTAGTAAITASCEGRSAGVAVIVQAPVATMVMLTPAITLAAGVSYQVVANPEDASGNALNDVTITWSTSNAAVATVSLSGIVTAVSDGTASITASSGGVSGSATVNVGGTQAPVASVSVTPDSIGIGTGSQLIVGNLTDHQLQLRAIVADANGNGVSGPAILWSSSDSSIATVSSSGLVTGAADVSASSAVTISAVCAGKAGSALVWVNPPVTALVLTPGLATLAVGQTDQLTATASDASGGALNGVALIWGSLDARIARQNKGLVTALAAGTATIVVSTFSGVEGSATITVTASASELLKAADISAGDVMWSEKATARQK